MTRTGIFTKNFLICFCGIFLIYFSVYYLIPVLPLYLEDIGKNKSEIGVIIGVFSASSIVLRPLVGDLLNKYTKKSLMILGALIFLVGPLLYLTTTSSFFLALARLFHGIGVATFATASIIMVANVVPEGRLAQATGIYTTAVSAAMGIAPLVGSETREVFGFSGQMIFLVLVAAGIILLVSRLEEPPLNWDPSLKQPFFKVLKDYNVLLPSLVYITCTFTLGTIMAFLPLFTLTWGYEKSSLFFIIYSVTVIATRLLGGGLSDTLGRGAVIVPSLIVTFLSTLAFSFIDSPVGLAVNAFFYAAGLGLVYPTVTALVAERAAPENRSTALGIFSASVDGGHLLGPVTMGYAVHFFGFREMFFITSLAPLSGLLLFFRFLHTAKKQAAVTDRNA